MAIQDLTGSYRNKAFVGGVQGGDNTPDYYVGPEPDVQASAETLQAAVKGIYEKYGRNARAMRLAKASPEYAALQGAGISVFGTPTSNNSGMDANKNRRQTTNIENATNETKDTAASQYAALQGGSSAKRRTPSTSVSDSTATESTAGSVTPVSRQPRQPESTPQAAQSTSMSAVNPPAKTSAQTEPAKEQPTAPSMPSTMETTKGPRLFTSSRDYNDNKPESEIQKLDRSQGPNNEAMANNLAARDKINRQSLRGGASGITAKEASDLGFGNDQSNRMLDNSDASVKMLRAAERNNLQDQREAMAKEYNSQAAAAYRADEWNKKLAGWQTEKGDSQIAMQTGEVQDRSQFGGVKVYGRETYKGPGGKEFVGNKTSEGFIGLPSKNQNEAETYNKGMIEVPDNSRRNQNGTDVATANKYNISSQNPNSAYLGQGTKDNYQTNAGEIGDVKNSLPSNYQKERFGEDVKKYTTGSARPAEDSNLTDAEYKKKKSGYVGPSPKV